MNLESTKILADKNIDYRLIQISDRGVTCGDVVKNAIDDVNPQEICKTIVVKTESGEYSGLFLKGADKIDFKKIKAYLGQAVQLLDRHELKQVTGKEPGEVCPLLLNIPILADPKVFETPKINFGSGHGLYGLDIDSQDLNKVISYNKVDISKN